MTEVYCMLSGFSGASTVSMDFCLGISRARNSNQMGEFLGVYDGAFDCSLDLKVPLFDYVEL